MGGDHVCKPPPSSLAHAWRSFQEAPLTREADEVHFRESAAKKSRWMRQRDSWDSWAYEDGGALPDSPSSASLSCSTSPPTS